MTASPTWDEPQLVTTGPPNADGSVVLAHGAGAGLDSDFMQAIATGLVSVTPGVFGFLVWELKENWRLYDSNRSLEFRPTIIGGHGGSNFGTVAVVRPSRKMSKGLYKKSVCQRQPTKQSY